MPWWQMYQILCFVSVFSVCSLAECSDSCVSNRHLFGITVLDHLLHKFNILLSVFLSVSSLEPFFQLIEPANHCISVVGEFNVFVLQRQQKLVVAIFALMNPFLSYFKKSCLLWKVQASMCSCILRNRAQTLF